MSMNMWPTDGKSIISFLKFLQLWHVVNFFTHGRDRRQILFRVILLLAVLKFPSSHSTVLCRWAYLILHWRNVLCAKHRAECSGGNRRWLVWVAPFSEDCAFELYYASRIHCDFRFLITGTLVVYRKQTTFIHIPYLTGCSYPLTITEAEISISIAQISKQFSNGKILI